MARIVLDRVSKRYPGGYRAVDHVSFECADGAFVVLVGPSGCGKSTTLRMIAGLEDISEGSIRIGERVVNDVAPADRDVAMVFQNYALYPHMTVFENMAFALRMRKLSKAEVRCRVMKVAETLGLEKLLDRKPAALSGGQRQRAAVGRAIVREPKAFLFDEPLSNLDAKLRISLRSELKALHQRLGTTTIYVTHDQEEAMALADVVVVMSAGCVQQVGPPLEVYARPVNRFVGAFVGMPPMNCIEGRIRRDEAGDVMLEFVQGGRLRLADRIAAAAERFADQRMVLGVRPQGLRISASPMGEGAAGMNGRLSGRVALVEPLGEQMDVTCVLEGIGEEAGASVVARIETDERIKPGMRVELVVDAARTHLFEPGEFGRNVSLGESGVRS